MTDVLEQKRQAARQYLADRSLTPAVRRPGGSHVLARHFNAARVQHNVRRFEAAAMNRLTASWVSSDQAINDELRADLDALRARARDLAKNNEYAAKFLRMVRTNIVGPNGFVLQARVADPNGTPDTGANNAIEAAFADWSEAGTCEVAGRLDFRSLCASLVQDTARDGEYLVRVINGSAAGNRFGFALQWLDPARIDTTLNRERASGRNAIYAGVEVDAAGRPVAYHLRPIGRMSGYAHDVIHAADVMHGFIPLQPEQQRGIPWMHAAMRRLNDLNGYREAAVIAARVGAAKMGFYTVSPDADPEQLPDGYSADGVPYTEAEPAEFGVLPHGVGFQTFDPTYPHDQFDAFCKAALRGIASGIGISYNSLGSDLEGVSFSSIRSGTLEERDEWMVIQSWFIGAFLKPVYRRWLTAALMRGQIRLSNGSPLPAAKYDKFAAHQWQPRRWAWVDPLKDVQAVLLETNAGLNTLTNACARNGVDFEDVLATKSREAALLAQYDVKLGSASPAPAGDGGDNQ